MRNKRFITIVNARFCRRLFSNPLSCTPPSSGSGFGNPPVCSAPPPSLPAPSPSPPGCAFPLGDANGDGIVSVLDLIAMTNDILGLAELSQGPFCAADVDSNGVVNALVRESRRRLFISVPRHARLAYYHYFFPQRCLHGQDITIVVSIIVD